MDSDENDNAMLVYQTSKTATLQLCTYHKQQGMRTTEHVNLIVVIYMHRYITSNTLPTTFGCINM